MGRSKAPYVVVLYVRKFLICLRVSRGFIIYTYSLSEWQIGLLYAVCSVCNCCTIGAEVKFKTPLVLGRVTIRLFLPIVTFNLFFYVHQLFVHVHQLDLWHWRRRCALSMQRLTDFDEVGLWNDVSFYQIYGCSSCYFHFMKLQDSK